MTSESEVAAPTAAHEPDLAAPTAAHESKLAASTAAHESKVAAWARQLWSEDPASQALGAELLAAGDGRSRLRMTVRPDMSQGHGTCHGGFVFALGDSAFAFACNGPGEVVVGSSADITWVSPAHVGDVLVADAVQEARFGRNGVTRVTITREGDGALIALFQGRSRAVGARPAPEQAATPEQQPDTLEAPQ